ncbi:MAG: AAA family ATPase [Gemmatimonadetes bacterium]|jgi:hypothetical protein|nr:AAA family ATPase [Gemmatimonadota bacterium]
MPKRKPPIPVYFTSLEIENIRCFGNAQRLDLTDENGQPARWTLILGDNGVGKTTLLQCLAWMRLVPYDDFETGPPEADDNSGEPPPLAKGKLGPALLDEENEILESLLRLDSDVELTLRAQLSSGATLSSDDRDENRPAELGKSIANGVQLLFAKRLLSGYKRLNRPTIQKTFGGEFHQPVVVAYGANRQLGVQNIASSNLEDPIASRLSGLTELYDVQEILSGLDYASKKKGTTSREYTLLERLRAVLAKVLPENLKPADIEIFPPDVLELGEPSGVHVKIFSGLVPMSALSLGYQTTLAWTTDLAWRLLKRYPASSDPLAEPAVVLIDEIDLHLHPLWQLRIIDDLSTIFRGTQFVATAHSPLMVQVAETANLILLRKRESDVEIVNEPQVVRSWRVDQILTSELFEIPRARDKRTESLFARRDELLDKASRTPAEEAELKSLGDNLSALPTAQDPKDQEAMDFIRKAAAILKKHVVAS